MAENTTKREHKVDSKVMTNQISNSIIQEKNTGETLSNHVRRNNLELHEQPQSPKVEEAHLNEQLGKLVLKKDSKETLNKIVTQHTRDTDHLFKIFPVELWAIILVLLESSTDLLNAWQSSNLFRDLLDHQRQFFLFPKVWKILGLKYEYSNDLSYRENNLPKSRRDDRRSLNNTENPIECATCGGEIKTQWYSGILCLRLVCKSWSQAITDFYRSRPKLFRREHHVKSPIDSMDHWSKVFFPEAAEVSRFLQHFRQNDGIQRSPFLGDMIAVLYGLNMAGTPFHQGNLPQFIYAVYEFTERFGSHVKNFYLTECGEISNTVYNYTFIRNIFQSLSNLEVLHVSEGNKQENSEEINHLMAAAIETRPLPTMSCLKFLSVGTLNDATFSELMRSNGHISKLEVIGSAERSIKFIFEKNLPNLRELSITVSQVGIEFDNLEQSDMNWPLTKLCLDFDHRNMTDWIRVFGVVRKWKDTLTDLILVMPRSVQNSIVNWTDFQFQMNKIKSLKLVLQDFSALDFILCIKESLEFLDVRIPRLEDKGSQKSLSLAAEIDSKIKFLGCSNQSLDSNIWMLCPKLKQIDFYEVLENGMYYDKNFKIWSNRRWDWEMEGNHN